MPQETSDANDLIFVERRRDVRIAASIPGRYCLDRRNARGDRHEYSCRAVNLSSTAIALAGPVIGNPGERVIAHIDHFGKFQGVVVRPLTQGFVMSIAASEDEREKLMARIEWFELHKNHEVSNRREKDRFVPNNPHSTLLLSDGTTLGCFVIDISADGVGVSADITPEIGAVVATGKVVGRVVRNFAGGFGVKFIAPQDRDRVERLITGH